jgi:uncharacterized protein (TIGR02284 family)
MSETATGTLTGAAVDQLNKMLRDELSALETYDQALGTFDKYPAALAELKRIRDDHRESVQALREHITEHGGTPAETSGAWGALAAALTEAAKVIGPDTTLIDLKRGEERGLGDYKDALKKDGLPADCRDLIQNKLLPRCSEHVASLDNIRDFIK